MFIVVVVDVDVVLQPLLFPLYFPFPFLYYFSVSFLTLILYNLSDFSLFKWESLNDGKSI